MPCWGGAGARAAQHRHLGDARGLQLGVELHRLGVGHCMVGLVEQGGHGLGGGTVRVGVQGAQPGLAQSEQRQIRPLRLDLHDVVAAQVQRQDVGLQVGTDLDAPEDGLPQRPRRRIGGVEHAMCAYQGLAGLRPPIGLKSAIATLEHVPQRDLRYRLQGRAGNTPWTTTGLGAPDCMNCHGAYR